MAMYRCILQLPILKNSRQFECLSDIPNILGNLRGKFDSVSKVCLARRTYSDSVVQIKSSNNSKIDILKHVEKDYLKGLREDKMFAVVFIATQQFKVSTNDLIIINKKIEANCGDMIRLEKVLAVGSRNFTLLGRPIIKRDLVNIEAMVVEKSQGERKIVFKKKRRKGYKRWKEHRQDLSVLKIKSIQIDPSLI